MSEVGTPLLHESAEAHVTGSALYTDDLVARFASPLHAWPVCSQHAHARILSIDTHAALACPGVVHVLTALDIPGENDVGPAVHDEPLLPEVAQHHGQALAWVLAETEEAATLGAARVRVEAEPLPAILTIEDALRAGSFHTQSLQIRRGSPEEALVDAPLRVQGELTLGAQEHFYLETQCAIATEDRDRGMMVHSSTQHPAETQAIVARVLGCGKHLVTCESLRMGGAFGGKEVQANAFAAIAALGARVTHRPVRVRLDRKRDMLLTGKRHPFRVDYDVGFDREGKLLALELTLFSDGGFSLDLSKPILQRALFHIDSCYFLPNVVVSGRVVKTHKTSQTAFRGFGGPQGMLAIEEVIDHVARVTGLDPHVVRQRNFYRADDTTHYGQTVRHAERIALIDARLCERASFAERQAEVRAFNASHTLLKRGVALTPVKFGISFTTSFFNQAGALVLIYQDGSVQLNHGGTEMGQGLHTKMLQVAADALGIESAAIRVMPTRTDKVPNTSATAASSGTDLNGAAVLAACQTLRERLSVVAARMLNVSHEEAVFEKGRVFVLGRVEHSLDFRRVVERAYLDRVPLFATGYYRTPGIHFDEQLGRGEPFHYFAYGAAVSEVEVDGDTGEYHLRAVDIVHDVGRSLSPLIDRGQVEGGFVQGLGYLTREEMLWDAEGKQRILGASTYKLPSLHDIPEHFEVEFLPAAEESGVIHGSKAVGEPPLMLAISVREALRAAVAAFSRKPDARVTLGSPATPEAVFWAIERVRAL